jgi:dTMP kinase
LTGGDRIERESISFHNKVRKGFLDLAKKYPDRIKKIKTSKIIKKTQQQINIEIDKFFKKKKLYV